MFRNGDVIVVIAPYIPLHKGKTGVVVGGSFNTVSVQLDDTGETEIFLLKELEMYVDNGKANTISSWDDCVWKPKDGRM